MIKSNSNRIQLLGIGILNIYIIFTGLNIWFGCSMIIRKEMRLRSVFDIMLSMMPVIAQASANAKTKFDLFVTPLANLDL